MPARPDEYDDMDGGIASARPGLPVDPSRLWTSIRRDWKWIPFAGVIWGALGLALAFFAVKHSYKSEAVLLWEPSNGVADNRVLATQAASLKLPVTLAKVKQRLKLGYPADVLEKQIEVWYDMTTNLVTIQAGGPTAEQARKLTTTVIQVFLENQTEIARARANDASAALEKDVKAARATLAQARRSYDEFRAQHGVTDIQAELAAAVTQGSQLQTEQQRVQAEAQALGARVEKLGTMFKSARATTVVSASSSNADAARAGQLRSELASAKARYAADHPRVQQLQAEIQALEAQAKTGTNLASSVVSGANPEYQALQGMLSTSQADQQSAASLKESYAELLQKSEQRIAALTAIEGKARNYLADIKLAEDRINGLEVQLAQTKDAVRTPPLEFRTLTPASLPEWPEKSKRRSIAIGMPIGGMLVTLLVLLFRPLKDGRIYTAREAAFWGNMPVVSTSAWPRSRDAFFPLIDELGDQGGNARGFTLVLSVSERERVLAEELAYWLGGSSLGNDGRPQPRTNANGHDEADPTPTVVSASSSSAHAGADASAGGGGGGGASSGGHALALIPQSEGVSAALAAYRRGGQAGIAPVRAGAHAWAGDREGPALRRAARAADRVLIVMSSGTEPLTSLTSLRTRLGRESGVALLVLAVREDLLHLPDRVGEVERFWRTSAARA
jgi:uncharacterized protein involved in exopolysaccharide biosynthesis